MEVYRIRLNSNDYQQFLPSDESIWKGETLKMNCKRKLDNWRAPEVYVHNPMRERGNFSSLCPGGLVVDASTKDSLPDFFEMAGELLPLPHQESPFFLLNVLECVNSLDQQMTKWVIGERTGAKIRILEYHFHKERFSESTIFKIPETYLSEILCASGMKDPEDEFKSRVEAYGLTGLKFEMLWSVHCTNQHKQVTHSLGHVTTRGDRTSFELSTGA